MLARWTFPRRLIVCDANSYIFHAVRGARQIVRKGVPRVLGDAEIFDLVNVEAAPVLSGAGKWFGARAPELIDQAPWAPAGMAQLVRAAYSKMTLVVADDTFLFPDGLFEEFV